MFHELISLACASHPQGHKMASLLPGFCLHFRPKKKGKKWHGGRNHICVRKAKLGTSLVVQGLRIRLPMQGTMGSIPGRGTKIPRATGQLNPCATSREPACRNYRAHVPQLQSPHALEPVPQRRACALQHKIPRAATKTRHSQKIKINIKKKKRKAKLSQESPADFCSGFIGHNRVTWSVLATRGWEESVPVGTLSTWTKSGLYQEKRKRKK